MLRKLLFPFSLLYLIISKIRNLLYDFGLIKQYQLDIPVISIGNLSTGGTGKTPVVIALIELLKKDYNHIVVISRGYKRESKGPQIVSLKGDIRLNVYQAGDESFMIANRFPHISVVVAEKRIDGFRLIESEIPDLIILDDGFQHRSIKRDLDIVLMNGNHSYEKDTVLPAGNLRESLFSLNRADCLVITKKDTNFITQIPVFRITTIRTEFSQKIDKSASYGAVSAIANNNEFLRSLSSEQIEIDQVLDFPDHHQYTLSDFGNIKSNQLITTEKDYFKIKQLGFNAIYQRIDYEIPQDLHDFIVTKLTK